MEIKLAEHAGACYGVQRALDLASQAVNGSGSVYTLGQLIHNPRVVNDLSALGVCVIQSPSEIEEGTVIIRSHGVAPQVHEELSERGVNIVDATCPHVARAQQAAAELAGEGCRVIIVGECGHPEVESLRAYAELAGTKVDVVPCSDDVPQDLRPPIGVVVQTTQRKENLDRVVDAIINQGIQPIVKKTICSATRLRQEAAAKLAENADAMVVIGGKNSSNTTRLAEICKTICPRTFHVESQDEIEPAWFDECKVIGITAGASTPESQINSVVERLEQL